MYTEEFTEYLKKERRMSENTIGAYRRDVLEFISFTERRGISDPADTGEEEIKNFLDMLKKSGKAASTVNRKLASIRAFFVYLSAAGHTDTNPAANIKSPRIARKEIEYLEPEDIEKLMTLPDDTVKGVRDRAILEVLYATGIRASELIGANVEDINLRMGFIMCAGEHSTPRIVPLGGPSREAVNRYLEGARKELVGGSGDENALFVNYYGKRITRQGLWKILREYGEKAQLGHRLTPNIIRTSFAVHMIKNGADLRSLQDLMGHEDITATQAYMSVVKSRIKDVYDRTHPRA